MQYSTGKHCVYYHRFHLVWSTKYRYKLLRGDIKLRVAANFVGATLCSRVEFQRVSQGKSPQSRTNARLK